VSRSAYGTRAGAAGYRVPPNALVTFKRYLMPGEWTTSTGVRPACGCFEVSVTYKYKDPGAPESSSSRRLGSRKTKKNWSGKNLYREQSGSGGGRGSGRISSGRIGGRASDKADQGGGKMVSDAATLTYADRETYARGLAELNGPLPLTMVQEWLRDDRWKGPDGTAFSALLEYLYVVGTAGGAPPAAETHELAFHMKTFAGTRDEDSCGSTLADFVRQAREYIYSQAAVAGAVVEPELISSHLIPSHPISSHLNSSHLISSHLISSYR
jgi:hypothetical protein